MSDSQMKITILGSGTSQGVPVIACNCDVCMSSDPKDKRLRASVMITIEGHNYVIDTGPDFRQQMLVNNVASLRGVLYTHEHKDHLAGMDDIRAFNYAERRDMEIYCTEQVEKALLREYYYVFESIKYPGVPAVNINRIENKPFKLHEGIEVLPIEVYHYKMPVMGFRIGDFTYITDAKSISREEEKKVLGSKVLIINALRLAEHISHFNLEEALDFISRVKPERAYITHISHLFARHVDIVEMLPESVYPAYDGQTITL